MGKCEIREHCCCAQKQWGEIVFYDKYAQLCKQRGVSMSAAAVEAGLSKSLVTKWKVNKVDVPSPDVLKKLSVYFGMPVSELLGEEEKEKPTAPKDDGLSVDMNELIERIKTLPEEKVQLLLQVAKSIE
jgi:transcriptional regulator with XRE-family HTH domain